jgi:hypothetical protein
MCSAVSAVRAVRAVCNGIAPSEHRKESALRLVCIANCTHLEQCLDTDKSVHEICELVGLPKVLAPLAHRYSAGLCLPGGLEHLPRKGFDDRVGLVHRPLSLYVELNDDLPSIRRFTCLEVVLEGVLVVHGCHEPLDEPDLSLVRTRVPILALSLQGRNVSIVLGELLQEDLSLLVRAAEANELCLPVGKELVCGVEPLPCMLILQEELGDARLLLAYASVDIGQQGVHERFLEPVLLSQVASIGEGHLTPLASQCFYSLHCAKVSTRTRRTRLEAGPRLPVAFQLCHSRIPAFRVPSALVSVRLLQVEVTGSSTGW